MQRPCEANRGEGGGAQSHLVSMNRDADDAATDKRVGGDETIKRLNAKNNFEV